MISKSKNMMNSRISVEYVLFSTKGHIYLDLVFVGYKSLYWLYEIPDKEQATWPY